MMARAARAVLGCFALAIPASAWAQPVLPQISIGLTEAQGPDQVVPALKILMLLTVLAIAPGILISMTSFTRIVIVLSFVRQAIGSQNVPPQQVVTALALLMSAVVMTPVASQLDREVISPYSEARIAEGEALTRTKQILGGFLVKHTRRDDLRLFYEISGTSPPNSLDEIAPQLLVPAFMISELRTGFEMGFLLFLPFVLIDLVVAALLTAMGMVMLPPTMISMPLKILLFVVVDGWSVLTRSLVGSFA